MPPIERSNLKPTAVLERPTEPPDQVPCLQRSDRRVSVLSSPRAKLIAVCTGYGGGAATAPISVMGEEPALPLVPFVEPDWPPDRELVPLLAVSDIA